MGGRKTKDVEREVSERETKSGAKNGRKRKKVREKKSK